MKDNNCRLDLPYPEASASKENSELASRLSALYAGRYSELSALAGYTYQHLVLKDKYSYIADTLECLSITEMKHFELLGKLIVSLGGDPLIGETDRRRLYYWNGSYAESALRLDRVIADDIRNERRAVADYSAFLNYSEDPGVNAVIERIIKDEEHHIEILSDIYDEIKGKTR
jgi:bacterioferritin